jgi:hypothetical protein
MQVVWRIAYRATQLLEGPWQYRRMQELMAVTLDRPMAGMPCSVRHCIGLSLGLHIVSAPVPP